MTAVRHNQAISAALTLASTPALLDMMRRHALPHDVLELLYAFSGDDDAIDDALSWCGAPELQLMAAIENYVQQVMAFEGARATRVLGVRDGNDRDQTRLHFRLLLKGCHPDQSGDPWRAVYAARVIDAWKAISGGQEIIEPEQFQTQRRTVGHLSFIRYDQRRNHTSILRRILDRMLRILGLKPSRRPRYF